MQNVLLKLQTISMDWSLEQVLMNLKNQAKVWGSGIVMVLGVFMIIVAVYQIAKGFMSGGHGQTNWVMSLLCLLVGGIFLSGGWSIVSDISKGAGDSIEKIGTDNKNGGTLSESGEGKNKAGANTTGNTTGGSTIILPFGTTTAYIEMK